MSVIIRTDTDRFVELDVRSITPGEAESSDAPTVDQRTRDGTEPETTSRRRLPRFVAAAGLGLGAALAARRFRGRRRRGREDPVDFGAEEADVEN